MSSDEECAYDDDEEEFNDDEEQVIELNDETDNDHAFLVAGEDTLPVAPPMAQEKNQASGKEHYICFPLSQTMHELRSDIVKIKDTLQISFREAYFLLKFFKYNVDKLIRVCGEHGVAQTCKDAGLTHVIRGASPEEQSDTMFECPSCVDDVPLSESILLTNCSHRFCGNCWKVWMNACTHTRSKIVLILCSATCKFELKRVCSAATRFIVWAPNATCCWMFTV